MHGSPADLPAFVGDTEAFDSLPQGSIVVPLGENKRPLVKTFRDEYRDALSGSTLPMPTEAMAIYLHDHDYAYTEGK